MRIQFILNDKPQTLDIASGCLLIDILSDTIKNASDPELHVAASGCRKGFCGHCLVLIDGAVRHSCLTSGFSIRNRNIQTWSWFQTSENYKDIQKGFTDSGYHPCRLCTPGRYLVTESMLNRFNSPSDEQIIEGFSAVQCHCSGFLPFFQAVRMAARIRRLRG